MRRVEALMRYCPGPPAKRQKIAAETILPRASSSFRFNGEAKSLWVQPSLLFDDRNKPFVDDRPLSGRVCDISHPVGVILTPDESDDGSDDESDFSPSPVSLLPESRECLNLNCKAMATDGRKRWEITCSDLAFGYAKGEYGRPDTGFESIDSIKKLERHPFFKNNSYERFKVKPARTGYYFTLEYFPQILRNICVTMFEKENKSSENYLLESANHLMAIRFVREGRSVVIYFYEPNKTTSHKRVVIKTAGDCLQWSINKFLSQGAIDDYWPEADKPSSLVSLERKDETSQFQVSIYGKKQALLAPLFSEKHFPVVSHHFTAEDVIEHDQEHIINAYYSAIAEGDIESTAMFTKLFLGSQFTIESKKEYLQANGGIEKSAGLYRSSRNSVSAIYFALQNGTAGVIRAWGEPIANSNLPDDDKIDLLLAECDGKPGLWMAAQEGQTEAIIEFTGFVLASQASDKVKEEVLSSYMGPTPAIFMMIQEKHLESMSAFVELVAASRMPENSKINLLKGLKLGRDQTPAILMAKAKRDQEMVETYITLIKSSNLSDSAKEDLMKCLNIKVNYINN